MRTILAYILYKMEKWLKKVEFSDYDEKINLSLCHVEDITKPVIILYGQKGCPVCKEIRLWLDYNWIPHRYFILKPRIPTRVPRRRDLNEYFAHYIVEKKSKIKHLLYTYNFVPQVELISVDTRGKVTFNKIIGHSKKIREEVEKFILDNLSYFPGFENGVYGDISPEESAHKQMDSILNKQKEQEGQQSVEDQINEMKRRVEENDDEVDI